MERLARIHKLRLRMDGLLAEPLPPSSGYLLDRAAPHVDAAFHDRLNPGLEAEYHWACGGSFVSFVEGQQALRATMAAEAERVWLAESLACPSDLQPAEA
jgi:hypothetical protein